MKKAMPMKKMDKMEKSAADKKMMPTKKGSKKK